MENKDLLEIAGGALVLFWPWLLAVAGLTALVVVIGWWRDAAWSRVLRRFADELGQARLREHSDEVVVEGRLGGRTVRVKLNGHAAQGGWLEVAVAADHGPAWLEVGPAVGSQRALARLRGTGEVHRLGGELDDAFRVRGGEAEHAGRLVGEARPLLQALLGPLRCIDVDLSNGWVRARRRLRRREALEPTLLKELLDRLGLLAPLCERRAVQLGPELLTRYACTAGGGGLLCPYCRDTLALNDPEAACCEDCNTLHHAECYREAGGCTVLGCAASARGRAGRLRRGTQA